MFSFRNNPLPRRAGFILESCELTRGLPDLILLDLMMPVMDGWQFRSRQLQDPRLREIPVVIISAGGNVQQKAENLSAVGWLRKPLMIPVLLREVEASLSIQQELSAH